MKQSTGEVSDEPLRLTIYPGQDGAATLYEDDGISLGHQRGAWQAFRLAWNEGSAQAHPFARARIASDDRRARLRRRASTTAIARRR